MNAEIVRTGKEATLYEEFGNGRIKCTACNRYCILKDGQIGFCGIRQNRNGKLYLLSYGLSMSDNIDPIEKKPLYHFYPGSYVLSISTTGCNWMCKYCQNYDVSQRRKVDGFSLTPTMVKKVVKSGKVEGVSYTYNEPTIFAEYAHDIGFEVHEAGGFNTFVSNGYMSVEAVRYISTFLDAITIDFKGNGNNEFARKYIGIGDYGPVFKTLKELYEHKVHIEITDLVIPVKNLGDKEEDARNLSSWVAKNLSPDVPVHFIRFHPDYLMNNVPYTPVEVLERFHDIGRDEGLNYVYVGNVPGHPYDDTYCPRCGLKLIERKGFFVSMLNISGDNTCPRCGEKISIRGRPKLSKYRIWEYN